MRPPLALAFLLLFPLATSALAQDEPALSGEPARDSAIELALGGDALSVAYRSAFLRGAGYWTAGGLVNEDDDVAAHFRWLRFAEPDANTPLGLGVGLGAFGAIVDVPDAELAAITLTGAADYTLALDLPLRFAVEASWAPDLATFGDGERVIDLLARVEADLSTWATAFVGYRHLEVDLDGEKDPELDSALHAGVRLGF
jgi:hypothetical protein